MSKIDYGPLSELIGCWEGQRGVDIAPEPDGTEENQYREEISFAAIGEVVNAEEQRFSVLHYRQQVHRLRDGKRIHDQSGYWMWEAQTEQVWHCFVIPRGVSVHAVGQATGEAEGMSYTVGASVQGEGQIMQTPFMADNAQTVAFSMTMRVHTDRLVYEQTSSLHIYGKDFAHTDASELTRVPESSAR